MSWGMSTTHSPVVGGTNRQWAAAAEYLWTRRRLRNYANQMDFHWRDGFDVGHGERGGNGLTAAAAVALMSTWEVNPRLISCSC